MSQGAEKGVLVLGDSHAKCFFKFGAPEPRLSDGTRVFGQSIGAASVTGFGRRRSALNLNKTIKAQIHHHKDKCQHVLFAFGQVDVELGLYYRHVVKGEIIAAEALFQSIVSRYIKMIAELANEMTPIIKGLNQTVLKGDHALLYTSRVILEGEPEPDRLRQKLADIYPDDKTRRETSATFNTILKAAATGAGIAYFDINSTIVDKETGEVAAAYCPNFDDHHIVNSVAVHQLHLSSLEQAIGRSHPDEKTL